DAATFEVSTVLNDLPHEDRRIPQPAFDRLPHGTFDPFGAHGGGAAPRLALQAIATRAAVATPRRSRRLHAAATRAVEEPTQQIGSRRRMPHPRDPVAGYLTLHV